MNVTNLTKSQITGNRNRWANIARTIAPLFVVLLFLGEYITKVHKYDLCNFNASVPEIFDQKALIEQVATEHGTLLYIGANIGSEPNDHLYSSMKSNHSTILKMEKIFVEPMPDLFAKLKENYKSYENSKFINVAVGDSDGEMDMFCWNQASLAEKFGLETPQWFTQTCSLTIDRLFSNYDIGRYLTGPMNQSNYSIATMKQDFIIKTQVEVVTWRTLFRRYQIRSPDIVIVDVEGYEPRILPQYPAFKGNYPAPKLLIYEDVLMSANDAQEIKSMFETKCYVLKRNMQDTVALLSD